MKSRTRHLMGLALLPLALVSCGEVPSEETISSDPSGRWHVSVLGPRESDASIEHCLEDPLIDEAIQSANLPSTHLSIRLLETATQKEAERIADCLRANVGSGKVSIIRQ
ncbi:hypothetical protein AAU01_13420 [Paenarthrobacter aurescens]|uniref:Lipoprotein n=1 Tax=Paenarthrobacter aurescens TaxID=43663 RepID=A0A4Y3NBS0_PAEAU|nr:hypothetical protein AAU01_13420 [Paenarthrobacter aurescens]